MRKLQILSILGLFTTAGCNIFGMGGQEGDPLDSGGAGAGDYEDADTGSVGTTTDETDYDYGDTGSSGTSTSSDTGGEPDDSTTSDDTATPDTGDTGDTGEDECDDTTAVTLYLSPDDSNSMSSPVQVREAVLSGWSSLSSVPIRTWEFLNYYSFDYDAAEVGSLRVSADMSPGGSDGEYALQIGVSSAPLSNADRAPMNITLVLDESGSMSGTPMDMLKATCEAIAGSLKEGDVVSMVTWDTANATVLDSHPVSGPDDSILLGAIAGMAAGGGTDLNGGLKAGYALAQANYEVDRINRIVLISDGGANAGVTDIELIAASAGSSSEDGIYMVGVGVEEAGSYNDELMDEVTDAGKGASVFIPDVAEAQKIFGDRFVEVMDVAARNVQVRLDLPPGFELVKFSGEEYSGDPAEVDPQHIAPNDSVVLYQTLSTCAPEDLTDDTTVTVSARFQDPSTFESLEVSEELTFSELLGGDRALMDKGAAIYGYAEALKAYREAPTADREGIITAALALVTAADESNPGDPDLAEIRSVLDAL